MDTDTTLPAPLTQPAPLRKRPPDERASALYTYIFILAVLALVAIYFLV